MFRSAEVLDHKRLGKQRVECKQILLALTDPSYGWQNHPAVRMWRGHEASLVEYTLTICNYWCSFGYKDTVLPWLHEFSELKYSRLIESVPPPWLGDPDFHRSHQSNLVRKNPGHYRQFWPDVPDNLPYIWPLPAQVCISN